MNKGKVQTLAILSSLKVKSMSCAAFRQAYSKVAK